MRTEVSIAVNFVLSFLYNRLPRRRVYLLGEHLDRSLTEKFHGHWYPEQPVKGTAFRCVKISGDQSDPIVADAAKETGLDATEVMQHLPQNLTLWIDPGEVSCRVGEKGNVTQLYSAENEQQQQQQQQEYQQYLQQPSVVVTPDAQDWTAESYHQQQHQQQHQQHQQHLIGVPSACSYFTAADFAQTKFGSTKLRQSTIATAGDVGTARQSTRRHQQQQQHPRRQLHQRQQQQQQQQLYARQGCNYWNTNSCSWEFDGAAAASSAAVAAAGWNGWGSHGSCYIGSSSSRLLSIAIDCNNDELAASFSSTAGSNGFTSNGFTSNGSNSSGQSSPQ